MESCLQIGSTQASWMDVGDYAESAVCCCFLVKLLHSGKMGTNTHTQVEAGFTLWFKMIKSVQFGTLVRFYDCPRLCPSGKLQKKSNLCVSNI